jgi:proteasome lid subunit RPN8/RPN11
MARLWRQSEIAGTELGFSVCQRDEKEMVRRECKGKECTTTLPLCNPGETLVLTFHTHPPSTIRWPSLEDFVIAHRANEPIMCVMVNGLRSCHDISRLTMRDIAGIKAVIHEFNSAEKKKRDFDAYMAALEKYKKKAEAISLKTLIWEK